MAKLTWSQTIIKNIEKYGKPISPGGRLNPANPNKSGWMSQQVKKRTTVTPLPKKKK